MKKNYITFISCFFILFGVIANAQITANDDVIPNSINGVNGGFGTNANLMVYSVLANDALNGNVPNFSTVTISQVSTTNPGVTLSSANIIVAAGTPAGTYTVVYQICEAANPSNCDTASVTVNVCYLEAPIIAEPTCLSSPDSLLITNLPATGMWILRQTVNGGAPTVFTGTGTSYIVSGLTPGTYTYQLIENSGCASALATVNLGYLNGLDGTLTGVYVDSNSDGIINVGDTISYQVAITNTILCDITDVQATYEGLNLSGGGFTLTSGSTNSSIAFTYQLTQNDINNGSVFNWVGLSGMANGYLNYLKIFTTVNLEILSGISLNIFYDTNGNGVQDVGENNFDQGHFTYEINNDGTIHNLYFSNSAVTLYETDPTNSYDITFVLDGQGACASQYVITNAALNNITVAANSGFNVYDFPVTIVPCTDMGVSIFPYLENPRPGFSYTDVIQVQNHGNQPIATGTVTFTNDTAVSIVSVSETVTTTANGFTFDFTNLQPQQIIYIYVEMQVPAIPVVSLGQALNNSASLTTPTGDSDLSNHQDNCLQIITGSYDPNNKVENHGPYILFSEFTADDYLTYTIGFENMGTADAETVVVTDLLDAKLDPSTIRVVHATHAYLLDRIDNNLTFTFENIGLPPSVSNTAIGKGHIVFEVKPQPGYAVGDVITNTAGIVFDFNPAIITNTVSSTFVEFLGVAEFAIGDLTVFPIPAQSFVNIECKSGLIDTISVIDILGKTVLTTAPQSSSAALDVSHLVSGAYFAKISSNGKQKTVKIIKE
ncbi:MAG TPA: T9SS type A sorting domain-containing protein [Flavobacterium sp.]